MKLILLLTFFSTSLAGCTNAIPNVTALSKMRLADLAALFSVSIGSAPAAAVSVTNENQYTVESAIDYSGVTSQTTSAGYSVQGGFE